MALQVGDIIEGKVTGIKPFGAFVSLPEGKNGLVHISEVSYEYVQDIATVLKEGQAVSVKVLSIASDGKIALSIKRTQPAPQRTGHQGGAAHGAPQRQQRQKKEAPPRVWQTTSPPVRAASIWGISFVNVKLLPSMRMRMALPSCPSHPIIHAPGEEGKAALRP